MDACTVLTTNDREVVVAFLKDRLLANGFTPEVIQWLGNAGTDVFADCSTVYQFARRLVFGRSRWAIREDDLKIYDAIAKGLVAAVSAGFLVHPGADERSLASAAAGIVAGAVGIIRQALKKGVRLDEASMEIVCVLKASGRALSVSELVSALAARDSRIASEADAEGILTRLSRSRTGDGNIVAVVSKDGEGRWAVCGF